MINLSPCSICLEEFPEETTPIVKQEIAFIGDNALQPTENRCIATKCNHLFHENCLHSWIETFVGTVLPPRCPDCRLKLIESPPVELRLDCGMDQLPVLENVQINNFNSRIHLMDLDEAYLPLQDAFSFECGRDQEINRDIVEDISRLMPNVVGVPYNDFSIAGRSILVEYPTHGTHN